MTGRLSRREAIAAGGALALGASGVGLAACDEEDEAATTAADPPATKAGTTTTAGAAECVLTPEQTEGPYYVDDALSRRDVREDREGSELELELRVQDAQACEPIRDATVEIWHADADGVYSAFGEGAGETFLRGAQRTDGKGVARFTTIYPGWYPGRAVHIHVKVHAGGDEAHTGQLYFDDGVTDEVHRRDPYASRGKRDVMNDADGLFAAGGTASVLALARDGAGYSGEITMTVAA